MDALIKKAQAELNRGKLENAILTFTEALSLGGFVHVTLSRSVPPLALHCIHVHALPCIASVPPMTASTRSGAVCMVTVRWLESHHPAGWSGVLPLMDVRTQPEFELGL
jgi:hypothetical protein